MRILALLVASLPLSTALAHHEQDRRFSCEAGEIRVAAVEGAWFDLYVDGQRRVTSRVMDGQQRISLPAGRHHLRATDFMGHVWSEQVVEIGCGATLVGEVADRTGFRILSRLEAQPTWTRGEGRWVQTRAGWVQVPDRQVCTTSSLSVATPDNAWYDLYVDGVKVAEARNFSGRQVVDGLTVGSHHVKVTGFMGDVWSEGRVQVGCGEQLLAEVRNERGLFLF